MISEQAEPLIMHLGISIIVHQEQGLTAHKTAIRPCSLVGVEGEIYKPLDGLIPNKPKLV